MLTAYQIAFDLYESATQQFLSRVQECFRGVLPAPVTPPISSSEGNVMLLLLLLLLLCFFFVIHTRTCV